MFKSECLGSSEHPCEEFGEGEELIELAEKTDDRRIKSILKKMVQSLKTILKVMKMLKAQKMFVQCVTVTPN